MRQLKDKKRQLQLRLRYEDLSLREKQEVDKELVRLDPIYVEHEIKFFELVHGVIDNVKGINSNIKNIYNTWGFKCPDINKLKTKEQKDKIFNRILNQFQEELKEWIYKIN